MQQSASLVEKINHTKPQGHDPILDDPLSSASEGSDASSQGSSSEEEEVEVQFPRESASELMTFLHREITNLQNMEDAQMRKFALLRLYEIFVLAKNKAPKKVYQEVLGNIQKLLFKRLSD